MKEPKLVLFGAGKIGRSFIGQLFSLGGYEVVFVDIFKPVIDELNRRKSYNVIIKAEIEKILPIKNVRGVYAGNKQQVIEEISSADILAVSIGQKGLSSVMPMLAEGLLQRYKQDKDSKLDIVIAENLRNAAEYFRTELRRILPAEYPLDKLVGLVETSIGKMVPIMPIKDMEDDILQVFAEPYNTLILDKKAFKNPIPNIEGLSPKENMKAWVDRKLFIHNLGHAATAYIGYSVNPWYKYIFEPLAVPEIFERVRATMLQSANILLKKYPDEFTKEDMDSHIDDLLLRFQNKHLGDTIYRVGCDLNRKLGAEDRLAGAIKSGIQLNLPYNKILYALVCGCFFRARDEHGNMLTEDREFIAQYAEDVDRILKEVCRFDDMTDLQLFEEADFILKSLHVN
jgi:mannitol-1-phosphate 5-dehydrogenase